MPARTTPTRRATRLVLALVAALALTAAACADGDGAGDGGTDPNDLTGVTWVLDEASSGSLGETVPEDARIDAVFQEGRVSGTSGCNTYGGSYEASDDGTISFGGMMSTQMACDDPYMQLESAYLQALGEVSEFQITDNGLQLSGGDVALTFAEEEPMEALALEGTQWTLDTVATGTDAVSSVIAGTESTLVLADGQASGNATCNTFNGSYTLDGSSLSFGPLASTKMACPDDQMTQETQVMTALSEVASYAIEGDRLTLSDANGAMLLGYAGTAAA